MTQPQHFSEFMAERELPLRRLATVLIGDPGAANDIVADVLAHAAATWDRIGHLARPDACVRAMIVNEYLSRRRQLRTTPCGELLEVLDSGDQAQAEREAVDREIAGLPRKLRAALVLRFYANLSDTEIAATLRWSVRRVRAKTTAAVADDLRAAFGRLELLTPFERGRAQLRLG
jgi:DNA-directed RNA polymerase specialized sigma24 family protein